MHPALIAVNQAYSENIEESKLADFIKTLTFPEKYPLNEQIEVFFSELTLQEILSFCKKHKIDTTTLRKYYEKYIKGKFQNKDLESLWNIL